MRQLERLTDASVRDRDVLFVFGNGFDIAHGIESSYGDFEAWVEARGNDHLIDLMDIFFSNRRSLWADIETALGEYEEGDILDYCRPNSEIDYDHMMRSVAEVEDAPDWIFKPILDEFLQSFHQWVDSIDIANAIPKWILPPSSLYFTFNYTDTLESVYAIPQPQVMHIHGSRLVNEDEYVVGHNNWRDPNRHDTLHGEWYFEQETKNKIIGWMNELRKDTQRIIQEHTDFFQKLSAVSTVVVLGHSLYEVDWSYFKEIANRVRKDAKWLFYYHTDQDLQRMRSFVAEASLSSADYRYK